MTTPRENYERVRQVQCAWCGSEDVDGIPPGLGNNERVLMYYRCTACLHLTRMIAKIGDGGKVHILRYGADSHGDAARV